VLKAVRFDCRHGDHLAGSHAERRRRRSGNLVEIFGLSSNSVDRGGKVTVFPVADLKYPLKGA
jgi:hypothetical protein